MRVTALPINNKIQNQSFKGKQQKEAETNSPSPRHMGLAAPLLISAAAVLSSCDSQVNYPRVDGFLKSIESITPVIMFQPKLDDGIAEFLGESFDIKYNKISDDKIEFSMIYDNAEVIKDAKHCINNISGYIEKSDKKNILQGRMTYSGNPKKGSEEVDFSLEVQKYTKNDKKVILTLQNHNTRNSGISEPTVITLRQMDNKIELYKNDDRISIKNQKLEYDEFGGLSGKDILGIMFLTAFVGPGMLLAGLTFLGAAFGDKSMSHMY